MFFANKTLIWNDTSAIESYQEKICVTTYANNNGADQPAHPRTLISAVVVRWYDSMITKVALYRKPSLWASYEAKQTGLI